MAQLVPVLDTMCQSLIWITRCFAACRAPLARWPLAHKLCSPGHTCAHNAQFGPGALRGPQECEVPRNSGPRKLFRSSRALSAHRHLPRGGTVAAPPSGSRAETASPWKMPLEAAAFRREATLPALSAAAPTRPARARQLPWLPRGASVPK